MTGFKRTKQKELRTHDSFGMSSGLSNYDNRLFLQYFMGKSFQGARDMYEICGYPKRVLFNDYYAMYYRFGLAKRIVSTYPKACWTDAPIVKESDTEGEETEFETKINDWSKNLKLWRVLKRLDILSGIGYYGCLFIGYDDVGGLNPETKQVIDHSSPLQIGAITDINFLVPLSEGQAKIVAYGQDPTKPAEYGMPTMYQVRVGSVYNNKTIKVHYSRMLQVAEDTEENALFGRPRMEAVFNNLLDIMKIAGGSAEASWLTGFGGVAFTSPPGTKIKDQKALSDKMDQFVHGMRRHIQLTGVEPKRIDSQSSNPQPAYEISMQMISTTTEIPMRILTGSERGELASSQDQENFHNKVDERKQDFCTFGIVRAFIDRQIEIGLLQEVPYVVTWPEKSLYTPEEKAKTTLTRVQALASYLQGDVNSIYPADLFLKNELDMDDDTIAKIKELLGGDLDENIKQSQTQMQKVPPQEEKVKTPNPKKLKGK